MKQTATARFAITAWEEKPWSEGSDLPRLTRASVTPADRETIDGVRRSDESFVIMLEDGP